MAKNNDKKEEGGATTIDKAFELLREGKRLQSKSDNWKAADTFVRARNILLSLAQRQPRGNEEEKQIAKLYEEKAKEYLVTSRHCLIEAMRQEKDRDEKEESPVFASLTTEDAETRVRTFYSLFSKKVGIEAEEKTISDQQWSIEERLQELNASLPQGFKTDSERLDSINRGLNRLGLSLYTQKEPFARFKDEIPKDDDEQVDDIIAQAKDEVVFEKKNGMSNGVATAPVEENDTDDESSTSEEEKEDEEDAFLDDEQLAIKKIRKRIARTQVKLAELAANLEEAKTAKEEEDEEKDLGDDDDDDTPKPDSTAYLATGKKELRCAQRELKKALQDWNEALL